MIIIVGLREKRVKMRFLFFLGSKSTFFSLLNFFFAYRVSTSHIDVVEVSQNQRVLLIRIRYYFGWGALS